MTTTRTLLFSAILCAAGPLAAAEPPASAARLVHAAGDVMIASNSGGRLGKSGAALAEGDSVTTGAGAVAVIALPDGSRLKLRESSRVVVTLPGSKSGLTEVFLPFGSVFAKSASVLSLSSAQRQ